MSAAASGAPTQKEKKYDRQLRLWGANGQNCLEQAHIALVNASATGTEILKNLVLPGMGQFTVIDDRTVEEADLGTNFFLDDESVGHKRAERAAALLGELNPDVKGNAIVDNLPHLLETRPELFKPSESPSSFTHLILVSPIPTPVLLQLPPELPTFLVHSLGFVTSLRISAPTHCVVETHPASLIDLRLLNAWPELIEFMEEKTKGLDVPESEGGMNDHQHGHVPYVLLLLKYLNDWKASHHGEYPSSYSDKKAFGSFVQGHMRTNVPGGSEENYEEAIGAVLKNIRKAELSTEARTVLLEDPRSEPTNLTDRTENFWFIASAIREFLTDPAQGNGLLPLSGGFPDMKAESKDYIQLQNLYRSRAKADAATVHANVTSLLENIAPSRRISLDEVELFTKHANYVRRIEYRPLAAEYSSTAADEYHKKAVTNALENWDADDSKVHDYIALRAWQEFYSTYGRAPGDTDVTYDDDLATVTKLAEEYVRNINGSSGLTERGVNMVREVVRAGGGEMHNIASLAGGMVAQEVVKIVTKQYIPVNNTVIFDGIASKTAVFEF